jgi:hypothetical protein
MRTRLKASSSCIPPVEDVVTRLRCLLSEAKKLQVILKLAKDIERVDQDNIDVEIDIDAELAKCQEVAK